MKIIQGDKAHIGESVWRCHVCDNQQIIKIHLGGSITKDGRVITQTEKLICANCWRDGLFILVN